MFVSEMEMLKARLQMGSILNESMMIRDLLLEDKKSVNKKHMQDGERYYSCIHDILQKDFSSSVVSEKRESGEDGLGFFQNPNRTNHHHVNPFHHILVMQKMAYLLGKEPRIFLDEAGEDRRFSSLVSEFSDERFHQIIQNWVVNASNCGIGFMHVYYDEEGMMQYCLVPSEEIIPIFDERNESLLREVIRYYDIEMFREGRVETYRKVEWWTANDVTYYTERGGEFIQERKMPHWVMTEICDGEEVSREEHHWGRVPFIPLRNNAKEMTDLQLVKDLIDAYDLISSEGTNTMLDLVDLYWVIQGYGAETASAISKKLQINKAVHISDSTGKVEAKQVELSVQGRLDWMEALRKNIFHFGMGIDTESDDWGQNASGVALQYQYATFLLKISGIMPEIKRGIRGLYQFAVEDYNRRHGTDFDWKKIRVDLNTSGVTDTTEAVEIIVASKGLLSNRTLLSKHPYVEDVNEELERLAQEVGEGEVWL